MLAAVVFVIVAGYTVVGGVVYELACRRWPKDAEAAVPLAIFWPIWLLGLAPWGLGCYVAKLTGRVLDRRALPPARTITPTRRLAGVVPDMTPGAYLDNLTIYSGRPDDTEAL